MSNKKKKDNPYTSIEITKKDRERLFGVAMKIKDMNNNKDLMKPCTMVHHAVNALEAEVEFFRSRDAVSNEVSPKTLN